MSAHNAATHEAIARLSKRDALVRVIDRAITDAGLHPVRDAYEIARLLMTWTPQLWASAAIQAGKRPPSSETVDLVVAVYTGRAG